MGLRNYAEKVIGRRAVAIALMASAVVAVPAPAQAATKKAKLRAFGSCSGFVHYARRHALTELRLGERVVVQPPFTPQTGGPERDAPQALAESPAGAGQDFSTTNVQEAGVDEPDLVKTDGKRIFVLTGTRLQAIDAGAGGPRLLGSVVVGDSFGGEILLHGDRVFVLSGAGVYSDLIMPLGPGRPMAQAALSLPGYVGGSSTLREIDVSDPAHMRVVRTLEVEGSYVTARLTGDTARVVFTSPPRAIRDLQPVAEAVDRRAAIRRTTTPNWRPSYKVRRGTKGKVRRRALVACRSIRRPERFSGLNSLTVLTLDLDKGLDPVDSDAILTDGQIVYGSTKSLYVATQKLIDEQPNADRPPALLTEVHKFDASIARQTSYEASGVVTGTLLNQFSMSEEKGFLRVASTDSPGWWAPGQNRPQSESFMTVLAQDGRVLKRVGRVGGLGKGERIYAVRMIGDKGYVVTFRQVDPLFVLDLGDPERPRVLGELDLLGYSAYLHPVGEDLLLGVGQAANEQGRTQGTQLSLFDVSDPAKPTRIAQHEVGSSSSSEAEYNHHAFLWWAPASLAVMPVQIYGSGDRGQEFSGAIGFKVARGGIGDAGRVTHPADDYAAPVQRSLVIGDRLFTMSAAGVKATDLGTFAERGFAAFDAGS
jgi:uncharacterized secreted protein with C-terminal beta-propeller domain